MSYKTMDSMNYFDSNRKNPTEALTRKTLSKMGLLIESGNLHVNKGKSPELKLSY